jgi:hypothetical protein
MRRCAKLVFAVAVCFFGLTGTGNTQGWDSSVTVLQSVPNKIVRVDGNLSAGRRLRSLAWASTSSNACFPATQNSKFTGNHVFFATSLPPHSIMTVTVSPKSANANLSIYGYEIGTNNFTLPEDLQTCVTCEADQKWDYPKRGKIQTSARSITFNAIGNSYNIFIGVAGANGLADGEFALEIALKQ